MHSMALALALLLVPAARRRPMLPDVLCQSRLALALREEETLRYEPQATNQQPCTLINHTTHHTLDFPPTIRSSPHRRL
jgi:hypothetical protein